MQILEAIIYLLTILMIWIFISRRTIKSRYVIILLSATVLVLLLHLFLENIRWQLFPLYLGVLVLVIMLVLKLIKNIKIKKPIRITTITVSIVLIVISLMTTIIFPVFVITPPDGDYLVGTESFVIQDETRYELYTENPNDLRRFKIQMWYPAESSDGYVQAPWLEDGLPVARGLSQDMGLPPFVLDHMVDVKSNSYSLAPLSDAFSEYPVIIISHGWRGFRSLHINLAEELASRGYIVVGIDHTYGSMATVFGSNDIAYINLDALPSRDTTPNFLDLANQLVNTYAGDITTTINYLEDVNDSSSSRFANKLDLTKIGLVGHSTGGGAGVAVALNDVRIDAIMGLDSWVEPIEETEINKPLTIPSLFLRSGAWETGINNTNLYAVIGNSAASSVLYQIDGITHYDFAMIYMFSPLTKYINVTGQVEGEYLNTIFKSMTTTFFNDTLKNEINSEINITDWPEVRMITIE